MEGQALLRSFEHLVIRSHGCLRTRPASRLAKTKPQRSISSRSYTSTAHLSADEPPEKAATPDLAVATKKIRRPTLNESLAKLLDGPGGLNKRSNQPAWKQRVALNNDIYGKESRIFAPARSPTLPPLKSPEGPPDFSIADVVPPRQEGDKGADRVEKKLRLTPSIGKSVAINYNSNVDLTRAIVMMESKINTRGNAVRKDAKAQLFHVRRGQMKKMKKRAMWRIRFKAGFMAECARVRRMLKQGW